MDLPKSDKDKPIYVTIPYFLYEAMSRVYYSRNPVDLGLPPVRPVVTEEPRTEFTGAFELSDDEIPTEWTPMGVARRKNDGASGNQPTQKA